MLPRHRAGTGKFCKHCTCFQQNVHRNQIKRLQFNPVQFHPTVLSEMILRMAQQHFPRRRSQTKKEFALSQVTRGTLKEQVPRGRRTVKSSCARSRIRAHSSRTPWLQQQALRSSPSERPLQQRHSALQQKLISQRK